MIYLLQLEWKKWRKNITFRLMMISYFLLLPSVLLLGKHIPDLPVLGTNDVLFIFPTVWQYLGYIGNNIVCFLFGFLAIIVVSTEYSYKTIRQNIITGMDRRSFFLSKLSLILAIAAVATLYYIICGLVIGYLNTDVVRVQKVFQNSDLFYKYFLMCVSYMSLAMLIAFIVKRTGLALFLYFGYVVVGEMILRWGLHYNYLRHKSMHFYPVNATEDLVPVPILQIAEPFLKENGFEIFLTSTEAITTTLIYTCLFLYLIYRYLQKTNL